MGRPVRGQNLLIKMRAYEMFATGAKRSEIARELGVTKTTITNWAREDQWEKRLADVVASADRAADLVVGGELADALVRLKRSVPRRIQELELLCGPSNRPEARLRAILAWLELAGVKRGLPNPVDPGSPKSLELIEDLLPKGTE